MKNSLCKQVGGNHYINFKIQPIEFIYANRLGFIEGNVVKYICRHQTKNGKKDLKKARHYIDLLIDLKYGKEKKTYDEICEEIYFPEKS